MTNRKIFCKSGPGTFLGCLEAVERRHGLDVVGELASATLLLIGPPDGVTKHILGQLRHGTACNTLVEQAACNGQHVTTLVGGVAQWLAVFVA